MLRVDKNNNDGSSHQQQLGIEGLILIVCFAHAILKRETEKRKGIVVVVFVSTRGQDKNIVDTNQYHHIALCSATSYRCERTTIQ